MDSAAGTAVSGRGAARGEPPAGGPPGRPRLGVLATHPIQYQTPLYQELSRRGAVDLEVAFLSDSGARAYHDPGFGTEITWDIDLLGGYRSLLLAPGAGSGRVHWPGRLAAWIRRQDAVVLHGHADPRMLFAAAACRVLGVPYLLRGDAHPRPLSRGPRVAARHAVARLIVRGAAAALPAGQLNAAFYQRYGPVPRFDAPYSVDNDRFAAKAAAARGERAARLASLGLDTRLPVVVFSGKLVPGKRPFDLLDAVGSTGVRLNLLVLGDGPLREEVRGFEGRLPMRCLGFVNQADLPGWYACGDILALTSGVEQWGLVVNEGMACGLVPVVSDAVGCAPDLVQGVGEVYPTGDVGALAHALATVCRDLDDRKARAQARLAGFTVARTAYGYEQAARHAAPRRRARRGSRRAGAAGR
jgi:glycosyltransferase involved in cell wall biosynthesis